MQGLAHQHAVCTKGRDGKSIYWAWVSPATGARRLQHQRAHVYENAEMQQRLADDSRMHFARWLYEHQQPNY
ncbi:MAG: hypothetical protein NVSMB38_29270 [Ktedonobacteraceae bacterium]